MPLCARPGCRNDDWSLLRDGLLTVSRHSIDSAAFWFIALERCCLQQLMIEASARPPMLAPPERARYSREHVGSNIGWLHFQPIYDRLLQTDPDMLDQVAR